MINLRCSCHLRVGGGGRVLLPPCAAERSLHVEPKLSPIGSDQEHLQRSLDLGPAFKQAPDFEYVAIAFRSQPRHRHSKISERGDGVTNKRKHGIIKIFGDTDVSHGYRTLEVVSGDRRLLFEQAGRNDDSASDQVAKVADATAVLVNAEAVEAATVASRVQRYKSRYHRDKRRQPHLQQLSTRQAMIESAIGLDRPGCSASSIVRGAQPSPLDGHYAMTDEVHAHGGKFAATATVMDLGAARQLECTPVLGPLRQDQSLEAKPHHLKPQGRPQLQSHQEPGLQPSRNDCKVDPCKRSVPGAPKARLAAERLAAAATLLQLPPLELRRYRGFCSELRAMELGPSLLNALCGVLVDVLGLAQPQVCEVLLRQPHVLRVPPGVLAYRGAALAIELQLPPPPGPGGGGPLAAIVAAAPDVLLRRSSFAGTAAALAEALAMQPAEAMDLLRREPQLLRHPPGFYSLGVAHLQELMGLSLSAAAALALAEPYLLSVSPGVLRTNGAMLRSQLQLQPAQLAEMTARAPELLVRSPGALRAVVQRLTAVLSRSPVWREALPRLLASPRNLAVALSFGSDRYDRLEYLAATGRDRIMGFKEGLSLGDDEFNEVFPEYVYNAWRRVVSHSRTKPGSHPSQRAASGAHSQLRER